jgi:hypothetical protein
MKFGGFRIAFAALSALTAACNESSPLIQRGDQIKAEIIKRYNAERIIVSIPIKDIAGKDCFQICEYGAYSTLPEVGRKLHDSQWALVFYTSARIPYAILLSNDGEIAYFGFPATQKGGCISCDLRFRFGGLELRIE